MNFEELKSKKTNSHFNKDLSNSQGLHSRNGRRAAIEQDQYESHGLDSHRSKIFLGCKLSRLPRV